MSVSSFAYPQPYDNINTIPFYVSVKIIIPLEDADLFLVTVTNCCHSCGKLNVVKSRKKATITGVISQIDLAFISQISAGVYTVYPTVLCRWEQSFTNVN